jgi:catechol 2,3-dioxygenase-like lactoylglutathione lyase family enzyme
LLRALAGLAAWPVVAPICRAQSAESGAELPLRTTGLEHLGILVRDVERAGKFYARVFNPELHKERDPPLRYYVPFGVGYVAIGAAAERPTQIDHYCALVEGYEPSAMAARLAKEGLAPGRFGMIGDPDGLRLQLLRVPGGLAPSTVPAGRVVDGDAIVKPSALDHVVLRVSGLDRALPFYRTFFGREATRTADRAWFRIAGTRLALEPVAAGETPRIARFCVSVAAFDRPAVAAKLRELGATISDSTQDGELRFVDPDGLQVALRAATA